jgi:hypothetical protein
MSKWHDIALITYEILQKRKARKARKECVDFNTYQADRAFAAKKANHKVVWR